MKTLLWTVVLLSGLAGTAAAKTPPAAPDGGAPERVSSMHVFGSIDGWRPLDDQSLIVWTTPSRPYLVQLSRRSFDLRYSTVIGVTSTAGTVYEKFDNVVVNGWRYPIRAIYRLDRDTARHMKRSSLKERKVA